MNPIWYFPGSNIEEQQRLLARQLAGVQHSPAPLAYPQPTNLTSWQGWQGRIPISRQLYLAHKTSRSAPQMHSHMPMENAVDPPYQGPTPSIQIQPYIFQDEDDRQHDNIAPPYIN